MKKILIIGCGGHAKSCVEILEKLKDYQIIGLVNRHKHLNKKKKILNYPIIGFDKDLKNLSSWRSSKIIFLSRIDPSENNTKS